MRVVNPGRFSAKRGDALEYNELAVQWMNNIRKQKNQPQWASASEMNQKNPIVAKIEVDDSLPEKMIELWVQHEDSYTGITGVIHGSYTDIWFLFLDGRFVENCPYPIFKVKK